MSAPSAFTRTLKSAKKWSRCNIGSLFSSPQKQATAAAQQANQLSQGDIAQLEQYVSGQQNQLRGAIQDQGPNPYFGAAQQLNPQAYYTDPKNTVTFGNQGPGVTGGNPLTQSSQAQAPGLPPVVLKPQQPSPAPPSGFQPPQQPGPGRINPGGGDGPINPITGLPLRGIPQRELM